MYEDGLSIAEYYNNKDKNNHIISIWRYINKTLKKYNINKDILEIINIYMIDMDVFIY